MADKRKWTILACAKAAYGSVFGNFLAFVGQNVIWMLLLLTVSLCLFLLPDYHLGRFAMAGSLVKVGIGVPIAVGWHRRILLGEARSGLSALRLTRHDLNFLLFALAIAALPLIPDAIGWLFFDVVAIGPSWSLTHIVMIAIGVALFYIALRLFLAFPLIAIGYPDPLRTGWQLSKGRVLSLLALIIVILLPLTILTLPFELPFLGYVMTSGFTLLEASVLLTAAEAVFSPLAICLVAASLSYVVRAATSEPDADQGAAAVPDQDSFAG